MTIHLRIKPSVLGKVTLTALNDPDNDSKQTQRTPEYLNH